MEYGSEPLLKQNNKYQKAYNEYKDEVIYLTHARLVDEEFGDCHPDLDNFEAENRSFIGQIFQKECNRLNESNIYFFGCSFENYKHNYETRFNDFKARYIDVNEYDFIESELSLVIHYFIDAFSERQINFSLKLRSEFLNNKKAQQTTQPQQTETEIEAETKQDLPYKIALLNEIGFFKLDAIKKLTKENQYKIISAITGGTHRTVKGNVLVLDPNSNEDRMKYTSNNYKDEVKNYLDKLK